MKRRTAAFILALACSTVTSGWSLSIPEATERIDALITDRLEAKEETPQPLIEDVTFLRRTYLSLAGRIPTSEEAASFYADTREQRRENLITHLVGSPGYVSHQYNYWADILRLMDKDGASGYAYQNWLKEALDTNLPYDQLVSKLVASKGFIWDNGAVGYYMRDRGMPLDNMSNTVRIFLGTRLECAQCHNHPFDKWTQMDYYKMAAFTYGLDSKNYDQPNKMRLSEHYKEKARNRVVEVTGIENFPFRNKNLKGKKLARFLENNQLTKKEFEERRKKAKAAKNEVIAEAKSAKQGARELYRNLRYVSITENEKQRFPKLPHDYQYSDAKPKQEVLPGTMFGAEISLEDFEERGVDAYAEWMTSPENPRFTQVIVNRMWKKAFGLGLVEPVDDYKDDTEASDPELFAYLCEVMKAWDYDLQKFQQALHNTKAWQRMANHNEIAMGEADDFSGPLLRRMTAEQIWDSLVALAVPEVESLQPNAKRRYASVERQKDLYEYLEGRDFESYRVMISAVGAEVAESREVSDKIRRRMKNARENKDQKTYVALRNELRKVSKQLKRSLRSVVDDPAMDSMMMQGQKKSQKKKIKFDLKPPENLSKKEKRNWKRKKKNELKLVRKFAEKMARASELSSPAPRGHFLREFGQSDREMIQNASQEASVTQALNLLNGPTIDVLMSSFSAFGQHLESLETVRERARYVFEALLSRQPSEKELSLVNETIEKYGEEKGLRMVVWSLVNTQQFLFIQ